MFIDQYTYIHCVGIGGIGISAIAKFLLAHGKSVSGSDTQASSITQDLAGCGVRVSLGHAGDNVPTLVDLVIYTEAVDDHNIERIEAERRGIKQLGHFEFLGELSKEYRTICITGTHGKSTTTAMTGLIFEAAGFDPTVFVGSFVPGWQDGNVRIGTSDLLIIEGDEYKRKMLQLHPETTLITNIEADHLDVYKDLADIKQAFVQLENQTSKTTLRTDRSELVGCELRLKIPGEFNLLNALGARAIAREYGIPDSVSQQALENFGGIWRRFERVGELNGATIISDYAHHPTAIKATLLAVQEFYPERRIVLLFEPHQHNRTKELFADFVTAFGTADIAIISEIYHVEGRLASAHDVSSRQLVDAINSSQVSYAPSLEFAECELRKIILPDDVVIIMGAGEVDKVARHLVA